MAERKISPSGLALIKKYEGFSAYPYKCPAGYYTIGWGSTRDSLGQPVHSHTQSVTVDDAVSLLNRDVAIACRAVQRLIKVPLDDNQFAALVSFTYNLGAGALQRSTLRAKVNRRDYEGAAREFQKWVLAGGVRLKGLVRRRNDERLMFQSTFKDQDDANEWFNSQWGLTLTR